MITIFNNWTNEQIKAMYFFYIDSRKDDEYFKYHQNVEPKYREMHWVFQQLKDEKDKRGL